MDMNSVNIEQIVKQVLAGMKAETPAPAAAPAAKAAPAFKAPAASNGSNSRRLRMSPC